MNRGFRARVVILALTAFALTAFALTGCGQSGGDDRSMKSHPATLPSDTPPKLSLTLAWNGQSYDVPPPAAVTPEMRRTKEYAKWWSIGDIRNLDFTDAQGRRTVAQMIGRAQEPDGSIRPIVPAVSRYRPDGTLEVHTMYVPDAGPTNWTVFAADGKTKAVDVHIDGVPERKPFIDGVTFYDGAGVKSREYVVNEHGVAYLERVFKPSGEVEGSNGSKDLDKPL
jgi:hypothetical protein